MNHPDGSCPLCLYALVDENVGSNSPPFMKLMSCFHCFHCDCIIRWWNWIVMQNEEATNSSCASTSPGIMHDQQGMRKMMEESMGKCPVCREVFLAKDIEHVLDLVGTGTYLDADGIDIAGDFLQSDSEKLRRQNFEAVLTIQQENSGLIEPKRNKVLLPGMFLPQSVSLHATESDMGSNELQNKDLVTECGTSSCSSFSRPGSRRQSNPKMKKHRTQNSRKQTRHWIMKDRNSENE